MDCLECKTSNLSDNRFCTQCGAQLGRTLDETVRTRGFRDRQATEMEIAEAVVERLAKWGRWLGSAVTVIAIFFGILLGKSYLDVHTSVAAGQSTIENAVQQAKATIGGAVQGAQKDIEAVTMPIPDLKKQVAQLQAEISNYQQANERIGELQRQLNEVRGQVVDLGKRGLKANGIESTGEIKATGGGPPSISFGAVGCPASPVAGSLVTFCSQGSPLNLFEVTPNTKPRPVSSVSDVGFQDVSIGPKPDCNATVRGTLYVEKGGNDVADKPLLCIKKSNNAYSWIELGGGH